MNKKSPFWTELKFIRVTPTLTVSINVVEQIQNAGDVLIIKLRERKPFCVRGEDKKQFLARYGSIFFDDMNFDKTV